MLSAELSIEPDLKGYAIANPAPCSPQQVLRLRVSVTSPLRMFYEWLRIHLHRDRPNRRRLCTHLLGAVILSAALGSALLYFAPGQADAVPACEPCATREESHPFLPAHWRALLLMAGPIALFACSLAYRLSRRALCDVYLISLAPHEPFPVVEQFLARSHDRQVFAVRCLSASLHEKYFGRLRTILPTEGTVGISTLHVTHRAIRSLFPPPEGVDAQSLWAVVRFALSMMMAPDGDKRMNAMAFTYRLHEWFFIAYASLLCIGIVTPSMGWIDGDGGAQFPLLMGGVGALWAVVLLVYHRGVTEHLWTWERMTIAEPFRACPVFRYSEQQVPMGEWKQLRFEKGDPPIRAFGMPVDKMPELALSILLIIYLTLLQLIK